MMGAADSPAKQLLPASPAPKRSWRWLQVVLLMVLLLTAVSQGLFFLRTEIAARFPQARPPLVQACIYLNCQVDFPRDAALLSIDDSDLQEDVDHANVMVLTSTIANHAAYVQAFPSLELTLTDLNDIPVLRRTFKPVEYLPAEYKESEGMPSGAEVRIKLMLLPGDVKASGYRVYLTYP